jgi:thiol-disulfide isomerase/thioredoxin
MLKRILALALFCLTPLAGADTGIVAGDNSPMPELLWVDGDNHQYRLSDIHDKPKLLHFWASWCIPCREELPQLLQWRSEHPEIEVLPLSLDQEIAQTRHFVNKLKLDMKPLQINEDDAGALAMPVVPYTILVSADNRLIAYYAGIAPWQDQAFSAQVVKLLLGE